MKYEELGPFIYKGLEYIDYIKPDEKPEININLLIEIRKYLLSKNANWYIEKFKKAYEFDIGKTRKKNDTYYDTDGIEYYFDDEMKLTDYKLYDAKGDNEKCELKSEKFEKTLFHFKKSRKDYFVYYYINEIDHFFTHCINNYLLKKRCKLNQEKGLEAIYNKLNKKETENG
ncbi:MAG: hypothetical protein VZR54_07595 [Ruminococcus sp.]|nr:hypothetical protein [Ruminococcus sp.]